MIVFVPLHLRINIEWTRESGRYTEKSKSDLACYECGGRGHFAKFRIFSSDLPGFRLRPQSLNLIDPCLCFY